MEPHTNQKNDDISIFSEMSSWTSHMFLGENAYDCMGALSSQPGAWDGDGVPDIVLGTLSGPRKVSLFLDCDEESSN